MGWRIIKQPNGKYARFSEIVDDFTHMNLSEDDVIKVCYEYNVFNPIKKIKAGNGLERWSEAMNIIASVHGIDTMIERKMNQTKEKTMKVKELMNILKHTDPEMEVILFAKGECFPTLGTQEWTENHETVFEIGGGWDTIYDGEE